MLIRTVLRTPSPARRSLAPHLRRRAAVVAAIVGAAGLAACGGRDPYAPDPANNVDTQQSDLFVYPLSRATGPLPSAISLLSLAVVRPLLTNLATTSGTVSAANFDFAVDRAADGRVRLLPSKLVVDLTGLGQVFQTGFQATTTPFDSIGDAPSSGYNADSAYTLGVGQSVIIQAQSATCSAFYAKLLVVSVDPATGGVSVRARVNPNCGFRSLRPGRG